MMKRDMSPDERGRIYDSTPLSANWAEQSKRRGKREMTEDSNKDLIGEIRRDTRTLAWW